LINATAELEPGDVIAGKFRIVGVSGDGAGQMLQAEDLAMPAPQHSSGVRTSRRCSTPGGCPRARRIW
jgi:hypothetical protein